MATTYDEEVVRTSDECQASSADEVLAEEYLDTLTLLYNELAAYH